jgi:hypothetical protein
MTARSWVRNLFARTPRTIRKAPGRRRPHLEALEDRTLPAVSFNPAVVQPTLGQFAGGGGQGGNTPTCIAAADLNGDGTPDLVTGNVDGTFSVLPGLGNGTFGSAVAYDAGFGGAVVDAVATADFNKDGKLDVAFASPYGGVSVMLNTGSSGTYPTFNGPPLLLLTGVGAQVTVGDFNGDGNPDLAASSADGTVSVFLGDGHGAFQSPVPPYTVGGTPTSVAVGDFNGDGKQDLVTANYASNSVSVLLGNGNGTFGSAVNFAVAAGPNSVAVGDFNRDGKLDLGVTNDDHVSVFLGRGNGTFQSAGNFASFDQGGANFINPVSTSGGVSFAGLTLADFNGDGWLDLAVASSLSNRVVVMFGDGTTPNFQEGPDLGVVGDGTAVAGDFNGDGKPDIAVPVNNGVPPGDSDAVAVLPGDGHGAFQAAIETPIPVVQDSTLVTGDFNGDGKLDVVISGRDLLSTYVDPEAAFVLQGNGDDTFQVLPFELVEFGHMPQVGDFNGDGKLDLATVSTSGGIEVWLNHGDGIFGVPNGFINQVIDRKADLQYDLPFPADNNKGFVVGDFNGDGTPDVALSGERTDGTTFVAILLGNGDGTFQAPITYDAPDGAMVAANFDGRRYANGRPILDLAVTSLGGNGDITVLLGNGDGTFQAPVKNAIGMPPGLTSFEVGDFNGDGKPDLAADGSFVGGYLTFNVLLGNGDGTFQSPSRYLLLASGSNEHNSVVGDVNGDGISEVLASNNTILSSSAPHIALSNSTVAENQPAGTVVGALSTASDDPDNFFTYQLIDGTGGDDNADFTVDAQGNLLTAASLDNATKSSYSIRVRSTDSVGVVSEQVLTIQVLPLQETVLPATLPGGAVVVPYSQTITAEQAFYTGPFTFSVTNGSLPPGLNLSSGGALTGTPTAAGSFSFTLTATENNATTASQAYTVTIAPYVTTPAQLVAAIDGANQTALPTTITLAPGTTFDFTSPDNFTDGVNALPVIAADVTILGGNDTIERTGGGIGRLFDVAAGGSLTLENLTLRGGLARGASTAQGGAIYSSGTLSLIDVAFENNEAHGDDGFGATASGGGLYVAGGSATLVNDTFSGNNATGGTGVLSMVAVRAGTGGAASGGALEVAGGTVMLVNDTFSGNTATGGGGGGGSFDNSGGSGGAASGAGLEAAGGSVTLVNDTFSGNIATGGAGGNGGIGGNGGGGGTASGGALGVAGGSVSLMNDTFSGNKANGGSGGSGFSSIIIGGPGGTGGTGGTASGGGLYVAGGSITLANDTLSGNTATGGPGGPGGTGGPGGLTGYSSAPVSVAGGPGGPGGTGGTASGGGLYVAGGSITLVNDTLSGNTATGGTGGTGGNGGNLSPVGPRGTGGNGGNGGNGGTSGTGTGGGLFVGSGGTTNLANTLIAENIVIAYGGGAGGRGLTPGQPGQPGSLAGPDVSGSVASSDHDLIFDSSGFNATSSTGDILGPASVGLAPLANNGGPTQTMALLPGSPAIDAGDSTLIPIDPTTGNPYAFDQRGSGFSRVVGGNVDIGAYEVQALSITTNSLPNGTYGASYNQAIAATEAGSSSFTFSLLAGTLPTGLTLAGDGTLSGTPRAPGSFSFTVQAQDGYGFTASQVYMVSIGKATPAVQVTDAGGVYNQQPYAATTSVAGINGVYGPSLEGVTPTLTYYKGAKATGTALAGAPTLPGTYTVKASFARSTDYTAASATATFTIQTPTSSITGPTLGVPGQPLTYTFAVTGPTQGITFSISYGDGTSLTTTAGGPSVTADHLYTGTGTYTIQVTATDANGVVSRQATRRVKVTAAALETDPLDPSQTALYVGGTTGADTILIKPVDANGTVSAKIGTTGLGKFQPTGHIIVYGQAGDDTIRLQAATINGVAVSVGTPAFLFGGDGNDLLDASGSTANNVMEGGAGNDTLKGGSSRDLLVGGSGADVLHGNGGDDILIGATTDYDSDLAALGAVMAEWGRTDADYATRINHLNGTLSGGLNGAFVLTASTVHDDAAGDTLYGEGGNDWFFARLSGTTGDKVKDLAAGEVLTGL